jgi:hypothetical protein
MCCTVVIVVVLIPWYAMTGHYYTCVQHKAAHSTFTTVRSRPLAVLTIHDAVRRYKAFWVLFAIISYANISYAPSSVHRKCSENSAAAASICFCTGYEIKITHRINVTH